MNTSTSQEHSVRMDVQFTQSASQQKGKGRLTVSLLGSSDGGRLPGEETDTLPWTEKYRPKALGDLISHDAIITTSESSLQVFLSLFITLKITKN